MLRRRLLRGLLPGLLVVLLPALLTGCGPDPVDTDVQDPAASPSPTASAPAAAAAVEIRVVLATDLAPAPDSEVKQQFDNLDCATPVRGAAADDPLAACDDEGVKYSLEPARIVGGIESATAGIPAGQPTWVVTVDLDPAATEEFAELTAELVGTRRQLALVLDGRVLSAPTVQSPIQDGQLEIAGDFTEEQATALADRLAG